MRITNTLTGEKETFEPIHAGEVKMYVCGPTVYGLTHIGNFRPVVFFNVVRNYLERKGFKVTYVSNFTDVDDKIINKAREQEISASEVSEKYTEEFIKDVESLGIRRPDKAPKVTEFIPQIIDFIAGLVKNGSAYVAENGEVFFSVRNFQEYGKLSKKKIDDLQVGARVDPNELKRDPLDFSLWKPQKAADEPAWESPWGPGRPGWHIECSAMAMQYCGETFDIHGGGMDLIHPHHENEIAQSEGLTGKPFVRYWMHNNLLTMESEKMSKSLGNIFLTRDFVKKHSAETLKFMLLSGHYRSPIDFSEKHIRDVDAALHRIYSARLKCESFPTEDLAPGGEGSTEENKLVAFSKEFPKLWQDAMDDDFNTAKAAGYLFEYVRAVNAYLDRKKFKPNEKALELCQNFVAALEDYSSVMNVLGENSETFLQSLRLRYLAANGISEATVLEKIAQRREARQSKDFSRADALRDELLEKGVEVRDAGDVSTWDIVISPKA
ncbi:MAG: cysteine--tRNA ligase [Bdellovibrionales bacterium]|nr:cysteine--tRNA ligase [Bdellovibrionales bacterium]